LALGTTVGCVDFFPTTNDVTCYAELKAIAVPDVVTEPFNVQKAVEYEYYTCDDKDRCSGCEFNFATADNFSDEVSFEGAEIEDHFNRWVGHVVPDRLDDFRHRDLGLENYDVAKQWCVERETVRCERGGPSEDFRYCAAPPSELADSWLPDCTDVVPPPSVRVGCRPGFDDGCSVAELEVPVGEVGTVEISFANTGTDEVALRDLAIVPFGNTPEGEFSLRLGDVDETLGCEENFPVESPVVRILTAAGERVGCSVFVDASPTGSEPRSAQLTYTVGELQQTIDIQVAGLIGRLVAEPTIACLVGQPGAACSDPSTVTLTNEGPGLARILGLELVEADPSFENFRFVNPPPDLGAGIALAPGEALVLEFEACRDAQVANDQTGELRVSTDNPSEPLLIVPLDATGECAGGG